MTHNNDHEETIQRLNKTSIAEHVIVNTFKFGAYVLFLSLAIKFTLVEVTHLLFLIIIGDIIVSYFTPLSVFKLKSAAAYIIIATVLVGFHIIKG